MEIAAPPHCGLPPKTTSDMAT